RYRAALRSRRSASPANLGEEDPKQSVRRAELRTLHGSRQHGQLLTEREVFQHDCLVPAADQSDRYPLVDLTRKSTGDMGAHVLASDSVSTVTFRFQSSL